MTDLNLWKQQLGRVPEYVWERADLETLILADNGLWDLPAQIGRLRRLRMLDVGHNQLTAVPEELGDLEGLSDFLYLHDNRLSELPFALGRLTKFRYLTISENAFESLPECVTGMTGLIELRATGNRLTELPDSLGKLSRLRELHLRNNQLTGLPDSVGLLSDLRQLDLRWVTTLETPGWFAEMEQRGCLIYR
jgi:Leucine-rich repeat (LRR) protein